MRTWVLVCLYVRPTVCIKFDMQSYACELVVFIWVFKTHTEAVEEATNVDGE